MTQTTIEATKTKTETDETRFVICDLCGETGEAKKSALIRQGWELTANYEFCGECSIG
jgi:hypothetical protein